MSTGISQVIDLNITIADATIASVPFGVGLCLAETHAFTGRVATFGSLAEVGATFGTTSAEYEAARGPFTQGNAPDVFKFGRVAATMTLTPTVVNSTTYSVTFNGVTFSYTSDGSATAQEIVEGLVAAATGTGYALTAVNTGTKTFTVSGNQVSKIAVGATLTIDGSTGNDGDYTVVSRTFSTPDTLIVVEETIPDTTVDGAIKAPVTLTENNVTVTVPDGDYLFASTSNLTVAYTSAETYAAALDAIKNADPMFYWVMGTTRTEAKQTAILGWTEANQRYGIVGTDDTAVLATFKASEYTRGAAFFHADAATTYPEGSFMSGPLQDKPGTTVWAFKTLPGYTAQNFTSAELATLNTNSANYYEGAETEFGNTKRYTYPGAAVSGRFIDITVLVDAIRNSLVEYIFALFQNNKKVPYNETGVEMVKSAIRTAVAQYPEGASLISLTAPNPATISPAVRATRNLPDVNFTVQLTGAIQSVTINGTVTV